MIWAVHNCQTKYFMKNIHTIFRHICILLWKTFEDMNRWILDQVKDLKKKNNNKIKNIIKIKIELTQKTWRY